MLLLFNLVKWSRGKLTSKLINWTKTCHSGLPTNFCQGLTQGVSGGGVTNYAEQQTVRKGQKQTYYCEICMIDLNR